MILRVLIHCEYDLVSYDKRGFNILLSRLMISMLIKLLNMMEIHFKNSDKFRLSNKLKD